MKNNGKVEQWAALFDIETPAQTVLSSQKWKFWNIQKNIQLKPKNKNKLLWTDGPRLFRFRTQMTDASKD